MSEPEWTMPQFDLGPFEIGTDKVIPTDASDEAEIYFEDEFENYIIEVKCECAGRIAAGIVKAVNNHDALVKALTDGLCELSHCADQLGAREFSSVRHAMAEARRVLGAVGNARD